MDAAAINAALVACSGTFELPVGQHLVTGQINVPPGKRLLGLGKVPQTWPFMPTGAFLDVRWGGGPGSSGAGGFALALPGTSGNGIMFSKNYTFGPAAGIIEAPNSAWSLFTVLDNQADAGVAGVPWIDTTGASTYFNVAYNEFRGFI